MIFIMHERDFHSLEYTVFDVISARALRKLKLGGAYYGRVFRICIGPRHIIYCAFLCTVKVRWREILDNFGGRLLG